MLETKNTLNDPSSLIKGIPLTFNEQFSSSLVTIWAQRADPKTTEKDISKFVITHKAQLATYRDSITASIQRWANKSGGIADALASSYYKLLRSAPSLNVLTDKDYEELAASGGKDLNEEEAELLRMSQEFDVESLNTLKELSREEEELLIQTSTAPSEKLLK